MNIPPIVSGTFHQVILDGVRTPVAAIIAAPKKIGIGFRLSGLGSICAFYEAPGKEIDPVRLWRAFNLSERIGILNECTLIETLEACWTLVDTAHATQDGVRNVRLGVPYKDVIACGNALPSLETIRTIVVAMEQRNLSVDFETIEKHHGAYPYYAIAY